jgi:hypothetical protein
MKDSTTAKKNIAPSSTAPSVSTSAKASVAAPERGTLVKKKNVAAGDPTIQKKPSRAHVLSPNAAGKNSGARYSIRVKFQQSTAPEAGMTQGNGRIMPAAVNRSTPNFQSGMVD